LDSKDPKKIYVVSEDTSSIQLYDIDNSTSLMTPKYIGFKASKVVFSDDGKIYIVGENTYIKTSSIAVYDISTGNLNIVRSNSIFNFLVFVRS
jgi:hypothetical protein